MGHQHGSSELLHHERLIVPEAPAVGLDGSWGRLPLDPEIVTELLKQGGQAHRLPPRVRHALGSSIGCHEPRVNVRDAPRGRRSDRNPSGGCRQRLTWNGVGWSLRGGGGLEWLGQRLYVLRGVRAAGAGAVSSRGGSGWGSVAVLGSSSVRIRACGRRRRQACPRSGTQSVPASADGVRGGVRAGSAFGQLPRARGQGESAPGRRPESTSSREETQRSTHAEPATPGGRRNQQRHTDQSSGDVSRARRTGASRRGVEQAAMAPSPRCLRRGEEPYP
jgi:hypothetical protein